MKLLPCGESAVLVEVDGMDEVLGLHAAWRADPPVGVTETVPAARTVLVRFDPQATDAATLGRVLERTEPLPPTERTQRSDVVEIPTVYDGEDLGEVAELAGMSVDEVVEAHVNGDYTVAFCGFAPGFGYMTGLDERLHVGRRATPRTAVPVGAVAIAGEFAGVYPRSSPGGWRILGSTRAPIWDLDRDPPALLQPGARVRFVRAEG